MNERNTSKIRTRRNKLSFGQTDSQTNEQKERDEEGLFDMCLYTIYKGEREMIHVCNYKKEEKLNIGQMDRQTDRLIQQIEKQSK